MNLETKLRIEMTKSLKDVQWWLEQSVKIQSEMLRRQQEIETKLVWIIGLLAATFAVTIYVLLLR